LNHLLDQTDASGHSYAGRRPPIDESDVDREISLGTPTILGIFFALALICACFFGFGYTMGRKSSQSAVVPVTSTPTATTGAPKPTAGSAREITPDETAATTNANAVSVPLNGLSPAPAAAAAAQPAPASQQPAAVPAASNPQPAASFYVQVAAVTSQDVADILLSSLQKKGYTVAVHHEPQDKLLHVQIGPFPDRKEADAMRTRVLADGFNAIVK